MSNHGLTQAGPVKSGCRDRTAAGGAAWAYAGTPSVSRPGPEAAVPAVKPARRLTLRPFGTISAAHSRVSAVQSPPANVLEARGLRCDTLDPQAHRASTTDSREPPRIRSAWSTRRRSRYLPFKPLPSSRDGHRPSRRWPRGLFRSACARGPAGVHRQAFLKRATAFDTLVGTRCHTAVPAIV